MLRRTLLAAALTMAAVSAGCSQSTGSAEILTTSYAPTVERTAPAAPACAAVDPSFAGVYGLDGMPEVDAEVHLAADGRFAFFLAIEEFEQHGEGCWRVEGDRLHLIPEGREIAEYYHVLAEEGFDGLVLTVERSTLLWELEGDLRGAFRRI